MGEGGETAPGFGKEYLALVCVEVDTLLRAVHSSPHLTLAGETKQTSVLRVHSFLERVSILLFLRVYSEHAR
jgi:hypothetical protein